jgi:rhodanese-related sulfurtransferase/DNA-binding transcriptional ArsR family regulator
MSQPAETTYFSDIERFTKSLANARRFQVAELLSYGEKSVEAISLDTGIGITSVSSHLQILKNAGIVESRKDGVKVFYSINNISVRRVLDAIKLASCAGLRLNERDMAISRPSAVTLKELESLLSEGECTLIDVRPIEEFRTSHIPGALSVPISQLDEWAKSYLDNKRVVIYCRGTYCSLSYEAINKLKEKGVKADIYPNGINEWRIAGFPLEAFAA